MVQAVESCVPDLREALHPNIVLTLTLTLALALALTQVVPHTLEAVVAGAACIASVYALGEDDACLSVMSLIAC